MTIRKYRVCDRCKEHYDHTVGTVLKLPKLMRMRLRYTVAGHELTARVDLCVQCSTAFGDFLGNEVDGR